MQNRLIAIIHSREKMFAKISTRENKYLLPFNSKQVFLIHLTHKNDTFLSLGIRVVMNLAGYSVVLSYISSTRI